MAEKTMPSVVKDGNMVKHEGSTSLQSPVGTRNPEKFVIPLVDIYEDDSGLTVLADLPRVDKSGLQVSVENKILTIEGKTMGLAERNYLLKEFEPVNFFRQFELSDRVDQDKISAELKNGVLQLSLPKAESAKPKQIEVSVR